MSLQEARRYLEDIVPDEKIRDELQPIVAGTPPVAFVTCEAGAAPTVFSIASQPANMTIFVQQNHTVAAQRLRFAQRTFGPDRAVAIHNLVKNDIQPDGTQLLYITYSDIVCAPKKARKLFSKATHVVLDDVHEQSVDQELACWLLHQEQSAGLCATIVMTTPGPDLAALSSHIASTSPLRSARSSISTLTGDTGHALDAAGYCDWVLGKVEGLVGQLKGGGTHKNGGILVFVLSDRMMWDLAEDLRYPGVDLFILAPRDVVGLDQVSGRKSPAIILMRPYFGARPYIKNICHVLCPIFDEQAILHCQAGKEIPTVNRLALDRIQFMADHARSSTTRIVHYAFTETAQAEAPPTSGALFIKGNCLEYYLKALHIAPDELRFDFPKVQGFTMMGLRFNAYHEWVQWVIRQLELLGIGVDAVKWMHYTGLSVHDSSESVLSLANFKQLDKDRHAMHSMSFLWFEMRVFNLAFIEKRHFDDQAGNKILEANDLCSTRRIKVSPLSIVDFNSEWRDICEHSDDGDAKGMYILYTRISSTGSGSNKDYEISGIVPVADGMVVTLTDMKTRALPEGNMKSKCMRVSGVIGNLLRGVRHRKKYGRYLRP
ncbi:hypothetical protein C8A01DRAFT_34023 [Parachaetomium inaequale]|uniref:Uncharacterized protein n=1 Tax=Parachaetomium inaequale TaxID=2588326 RepID=A0AAN6STU2_9PEZI|nr:hypothetical protein C8A01DRAFT_34023 [Parachaetomium inaequale]